MLQTITVENMRRLEKAATEDGLSYTRLMENAGTAAAREIMELFPLQGRKVAVLCGSGNNGGDGYVIARLLAIRGARVSLIQTDGEPRTEDARYMARLTDESNVQIYRLSAEPYLAAACVKDAALVVDAVYGIGFHGLLPDALRSLFRLINTGNMTVVAVDVPSGLNAETGEYDTDVLRADLTVTFTAAKPAMALPAVQEMLGRLIVASVGIEESLVAEYAENIREIDRTAVAACFVPRSANSHKGSFGRLLCICGSFGMAGAAMMAGKAALRCGLGLLDMAVPRSIYPLMAGQLWEAVYAPLPETTAGTLGAGALTTLETLLEGRQAVLIGCGLSQNRETAATMMKLLPRLSVPTVVDADGLNILAAHIDEWKTVNAPLVLTPHPGEMARLTGLSIADVQADRVRTARRFAARYGVTLVLKGHRTVIASPDGQVLINTTGCAGMATGGSGDVLAGMIASFLAQGLSPVCAAMCGVYLHGAAGQQAAKRLSQISMLPTDLIEELPSLFLQFEKQE